LEVVPCVNSCGLDKQALGHPHLGLDGCQTPLVLVIGEAPGATEDAQGHLFVGDSGQLLRKILTDDAGIDIAQVGFVNVLGCRPPGNATPTPAQIRCCLPRLEQIIDTVAPTCKLILLMGNTAMSVVLGEHGIKAHHGQVFQRKGVWIVPCYHPAYILREPDALQTFIADIVAAYTFTTTQFHTDIPAVSADSTYLQEHLDSILHPDQFLAFDTETEGLDPYSDDAFIICVSLSWSDTEACTVVLEHSDLRCSPQELRKRMTLLRTILESSAPKTSHNGKFDCQYLKQCLDIEVQANVSDTINLFHLVDENSDHNLSLAVRRFLPAYTGYDTEKDMWFRRTRYHMPLVPLRVIEPYSCGDAFVARKLAILFRDQLSENPTLTAHAYTGVIPATTVYTRMEAAGVQIDLKAAAELAEDYREKRQEIAASILSLPVCEKWRATRLLTIQTSKDSEATNYINTKAKLDQLLAESQADPKRAEKVQGQLLRLQERLTRIEGQAQLNLDSPEQLHSFIYDPEFCGLPPQRNRDTNNLTIDKDARSELLDLTEGKPRFATGRRALELLGAYNRVTKLGTTYAEQASSWLHGDGLVHTQMKQWGTVTGRCAYAEPNLQNIPRNQADTGDPLDAWLAQHNLKRMFISKFSDGVLLNMDFSQLELRIMATISQDDIMCRVYQEGGDLHAQTGRLLHPDYDLVSPDVRSAYRSEGKTYNFASVYAMKPEYLEMYPGLKAWVDKTKKFAQNSGYTENPFGRRRRISELQTYKGKYELSHALKQAVNFVIQSTGHEMLLLALIAIDRELRENGFQSHLVFEVHDSLVLDCLRTEVEDVARVCKKHMEDISSYPWITIPILVDASCGPNWEEQEELHVS
jgi:uracil-DNA glycosylase family 4